MLGLPVEIQRRVDEFDPRAIESPRGKLPEGIDPVGEVSDELRRLYMVHLELRSTFQHAVVDMAHTLNEERYASLERRAHLYEEQADVAQAIFWASLHIEMGVFSSLQLCEGWKVIKVEASPETLSLEEAQDTLLASILRPFRFWR